MQRIIHLGLGEIGKGVIRAIAARPQHAKLVGVIDIHPDLQGKSLRDLMPGDNVPNLHIRGSVREALQHAGWSVDTAILTTGSTTQSVRKTLEELIAARIHVVSSCEELSYPNLRSAKPAAALDALAKKAGVVILGTGVNPGFAMDVFALTCTAVCSHVSAIKVVRTLDAGRRRYMLQKKVAAGMTVAAVRKLIRANAIGHVGLAESVAMIAEALGWDLDDIQERFVPVIAKRPVRSDHFTVKTGQVRGMQSIAIGIVGGKKKIELDLTMALAADTYDEVTIHGTPSITVRTTTGFPGDASTVGMLVNCAAAVHTLQPGVRTMLDALKIHSIGV